MHPPLKPGDEAQRQAAVDELLISDPALQGAFDHVTHLVSSHLHVPISAFTIIDRERQLMCSIQGLDVDQTPRDVSFCGHTILQNDIFVVPNALRHASFHDNPLVLGATAIRFYAGAPVRAPNQQPIGSLCAIDTRPRQLTAEMRDGLLDLRDILEALILFLSESVQDHLTGLSNRRHFDQVIRREWNRACRLRLPVALMTIDIDNFKAYNDSYGHQQGDWCLRQLAQALKTECKRSGDMPFRTGGEEFAVLLTTTSQGAAILAEHLRQAIRDLAIPHGKSPFKVVTVSVGLVMTESPTRDVNGLDDFILCSDRALYAAKAQGRNRVVVWRFSP